MGRTKGPENSNIKERLKKIQLLKLCKRGQYQELMASSGASEERSLFFTPMVESMRRHELVLQEGCTLGKVFP